MAEPKTGEQKPFAEYLRDAPRHQGGTVTLTGRVSQSDKEGHFVLETGDGQTLELPTGSVRGYKVVEEAGKLVQVEIHAKDLEAKSIVQENIRTVAALDVNTIKEVNYDTLKELIHDTLKETHKDPIYDTVKEVIETIVEGGGTLAEGINDPGQQIGQPVAGGAVPFTLATAHQAPQNALALQGLSGQVSPLVAHRAVSPLQQLSGQPNSLVYNAGTLGGYDVQTLKEISQDTLKEGPHDTIKEGPYDTLKEAIYDTLKETHKDPIVDTVKEVVETVVEGGGTIAEGSGLPGGGNQF
ncbi:MAG TPA: hypothetical protein VF173_09105 [Thermoanaerobaculia bacterium]|nr:hypothetical protein [Thermoanaerobaculia bacterium]